MASKIQFKRGSTSQSNLYRGAEGEVIINTTKDTIVVHDGIQTGGYEIIRSDLSNISGNVPAVNITYVDCGTYSTKLSQLDGGDATTTLFANSIIGGNSATTTFNEAYDGGSANG